MDIDSFLESWSEELLSRANRVRNLIGDAHWLSDGSHKESLLRDFLGRHLPKQLTVSNGFITSSSGAEECSPEIDILIADSTVHAPLFAESGLYITPPISVAAHIQVKTSFAKNELISSLKNIQGSQAVIASRESPSRVWRGVFFYSVSETRTESSVLDTLTECIKEVAANWSAAGVEIIDLLPTCIVAISDWVIFLSATKNQQITIRLFSLAKLSAACALADLLASLRLWSGGPITGDLDRAIELASQAQPLVRTINFCMDLA